MKKIKILITGIHMLFAGYLAFFVLNKHHKQC